MLEDAAAKGTIVVSSPSFEYGAPQADSTGSRYVSLIWINTTVKNAPFDQLELLNLKIVEYGLSNVKSTSAIPEYAPTFIDAEQQAQAYGLNMFSGYPDPYYNYGEHEDVSLLDIKNEVVANLADESHKIAYDNAKVRVQGTVAGFSNHIIYVEDFCFYYNEEGQPIYKSTGEINENEEVIVGETGEYAGLNIFAGMGSIPSKFTTVGNYIQVCGLALDSDFGFQITDGKFKTIPYDENDAQLLIPAKDNTEIHALKTFEFTPTTLSAAIQNKDYTALNCRFTLTEPMTITRSFDADSGAIYLYDGNGTGVYVNFVYKPYPKDTSVSWNKGAQFEGHQFLISGVLAIHKTSKGERIQLCYPGKTTDIVWVDVPAA